MSGYNFICLKWGDKYSEEFVIKLYNMISRHYSDFSFWCMSDTKIDHVHIQTIPLPEDNLQKWWWKMWLFNEEWMDLDNAVFLDLDLIIQKPFVPKFDSKVTMLYTDWIDVEQMHKDILTDRYKYCEINSSIMSWDRNTKRHHIWEDFVRHKEKILFLFRGIDNYINNRHKDDYRFYDSIAHSYWTTGKTWKDKPVILFDYEQDKQDKVNEEWVKQHWK